MVLSDPGIEFVFLDEWMVIRRQMEFRKRASERSKLSRNHKKNPDQACHLLNSNLMTYACSEVTRVLCDCRFIRAAWCYDVCI
jgi:hypothetical protein